MSEFDSWSGSEDAPDATDAPPVAEQMRAATRSLRAHLSLVRPLPDKADDAGR